MQIFAWCASVLVFFAFFMKTMIPLRIVAIGSNLFFITYALVGIYYDVFWKVFPILTLHVCLLPLNLIRLRQMKGLIQKMGEASDSKDSVNILIPYMTLGKYKAGRVLFKKGDKATRFFFIQKGSVEIPELEKQLGEGTVFGEVGIFGPGSIRSAGATCTVDSEIYSISKDQMLQLYFQNPKFGFFIVKLMAHYAVDNVNKLAPSKLQDETQE